MPFSARTVLRSLSVGCLLLLLTLVASARQAAPPAAPGAQGEWRSYHGSNRSDRYSPLDQVTRDNVANLEVAWRWKAENAGPRPEFKNETTPLAVNGVLYFTAGYRRNVVAVDATSGETLWIWRMDEGPRGEKAPRRNSGRGVAYWSDGRGDDRIVTVTPGYHLVALDAKTGLPISTFGTKGVVDLMQGTGQAQENTADPVGHLGNSSPPLISNGVVVVPPALQSGFNPLSKMNVPGNVRGFDVRTGKQLWLFRTVPIKGEFGNETWEGDSWKYTGNAGVWAPISADDALGYIYLPVESPTNDFYGGHRLGDNLFSTSLVCLDVKTGKRVWHFQIIHHDIWDWDNPTAPILLDVTVEGRPVKAVIQLTKQSFAYVFDRVTGKPVWPIEERPVPQSDVPGERSSPTQPFPTKPAAYDRQGITEDVLLDFTPELRAEALEIAKRYRWGKLFSPPSLADASDGTKGTLLLPGDSGGTLWEHGAADPETGLLYVGSSTDPEVLGLVKNPKSDLAYGVPSIAAPGPRGLSLVKPPYGRITAIDLNTGDHAWMIPNGDTPPALKNHPALQGVDLGRTGSPSRAGILVTKTLLFAGEGWGGQPMFRALDKKTGAILWETKLPGMQTGLPMTYMAAGRQYIVFTVGDARAEYPAELLAFRLADK
jgi:quinoprotein glucose dehydrogenase